MSPVKKKERPDEDIEEKDEEEVKEDATVEATVEELKKEEAENLNFRRNTNWQIPKVKPVNVNFFR